VEATSPQPKKYVLKRVADARDGESRPRTAAAPAASTKLDSRTFLGNHTPSPPDTSGLFRLTVRRRIETSPYKYEREVKPNDLLSTAETAKVLGITVRHLYRLVDEGHLKYKKQRKRLWFVSRDVQRLVQARGRLSPLGPWLIG
jgi:excisionase family DNA binding protein